MKILKHTTVEVSWNAGEQRAADRYVQSLIRQGYQFSIGSISHQGKVLPTVDGNGADYGVELFKILKGKI